MSPHLILYLIFSGFFSSTGGCSGTTSSAFSIITISSSLASGTGSGSITGSGSTSFTGSGAFTVSTVCSTARSFASFLLIKLYLEGMIKSTKSVAIIHMIAQTIQIITGNFVFFLTSSSSSSLNDDAVVERSSLS